MKHVQKTFLTVILATFCLVGCSQKADSLLIRPAKINHVVFCGLKNPNDTRSFMQDCETYLASIDGVVSYWCGVHGDYGRSTVDGAYDVGLYVGFNSDEAYENYIVDPKHVYLVDKWKSQFDSLRIFDVIDEPNLWGSTQHGDINVRATIEDVQSIVGGDVVETPIKDPMTLEPIQ